MPLSEDDIREILRLIDESDVAELRVETETFSLHVRRGDVAASPADAEPISEAAVAGVFTIAAPMLGTFYRAGAPGAAPFVAVGTPVEPDTIVCLIEVMKMMNPVSAGVVGEIVEVCVENAELVELGTTLFLVQPER
jgi:biotin carboxyl carrier protein